MKKEHIGKMRISIARKIMLLVCISSMVTVIVSELIILPKVTSLYQDSIRDNMRNLVKAYGSLVEYRLERNGYSMLLQEELDALFETGDNMLGSARIAQFIPNVVANGYYVALRFFGKCHLRHTQPSFGSCFSRMYRLKV